MMLLKYCTPYVSKFGKLSSGHRTGKGPFSFQSQRKAKPKKVQITIQLHSFSHASARLGSKSFKLGFSSMRTENFQMFKQDLENTEPSEIKFSTSMAHRKSKGIPKSIYFCFIDYTKASDYVDHNKLWKILQEMGISDYLTCLLKNLYFRLGSNS